MSLKLDDPLLYRFVEMIDDEYEAVINEWLEKQDSVGARQSWRLIPGERYRKILDDFMRYGFVRDEAGVEKMVDIVIGNVARLHVNTDLSGHSQVDPDEIAEFHGLEPEVFGEDFGDFIRDPQGAWRISDFALKPLENIVFEMLDAPDARAKLLLIDRALQITHMRSDLASWFIEGGANTLTFIFHYGEELAA